MKHNLKTIVVPVAVFAGLLLIWEAGCQLFGIEEFLLPSPTVIMASYIKWQGAILHNAAQTLFTTLAGFSVAVVVGLLLGGVVGFSSMTYTAVYPVLVGFNSIPKAAIVPILVIWFGIGTVPAIISAFLTAFFPIVVNVATGLATLEPELQELLRSLGASRLDIFRKVGIPRALPLFFGSLKIAITLAFVGSVVAETVASNLGIGYLMIAASSRFDVPLVFAGLMVVALQGVLLYGLFAVLERRFTSWAYRGLPGE